MLRIYLSGRITIEADHVVLGPADFPGPQGQTAFAYVVSERSRPVARAELAEVLWPRELPASWESALNAIMSRLRRVLARAGLDGAATLSSAGGCYECRLPHGAWIDLEAAVDSIHEAESALRAGEPGRAYGPSAVAHHIARRPLLPAGEGRWVEERREKHRGILVRALECRAEVYLWNGEYPLAVEAARDVVALSPFREAGYRLLMRAHAAGGNVAEALRVYEQCRALIADELGVGPSVETRAVHADLLRTV